MYEIVNPPLTTEMIQAYARFVNNHRRLLELLSNTDLIVGHIRYNGDKKEYEICSKEEGSLEIMKGGPP